VFFPNIVHKLGYRTSSLELLLSEPLAGAGIVQDEATVNR
jgi:hypothetical protein